MELQDEIFKSLVDKGLIGLLILLAGFILNRVLEKYKSGQSLHNELAKTRVSKISECWETIYRSDSLAKKLIEVASIGLSRHQGDWSKYVAYLKEHATKIEPELHKEIEKSNIILDMNRFWIGQSSYDNLKEYLRLIIQYVDSFTVGDSKKMIMAEASLKSKRLSVVEIFNLIKSEK